MPEALIFDVDATLAETEKPRRRGFNEAFAEAGLGAIVTPSLYTVDEDFSEALCLLPDLTAAGGPRAVLDLARDLKRLEMRLRTGGRPWLGAAEVQ